MISQLNSGAVSVAYEATDAFFEYTTGTWFSLFKLFNFNSTDARLGAIPEQYRGHPF